MSLQCLSMPRFYRVLVGIQSPEGVTSTRGVLRRFNDFLKLFHDLKKTFPKKSLPSAPPKGLLRMKSQTLLEERRRSLEEWMSKLLSDIDVSRSMAVASFLELEAAARSSFQDVSQQPSEANASTTSSISSDQIHSSLSLPALAGSSSIVSDYGSDTAYETSELESPSFGRDDVSEIGVDELTLNGDLTNPMETMAKYSMSNIDEGLLMGESILDQLESFKKHKILSTHITPNGSAFKSATVNRAGISFEEDPVKVVKHMRKPSNESVGSDLSSYKGGETSNLWSPNLLGEECHDLPNGVEASRTMGSPSSSELQYSAGDIVLPRDQQPKLDRILMILQRRLGTAKTDMEDLISRLNQEIAVKEYLTTKVKDLEVELETTKEKSKENLQQALSLEKERITTMQWDMEELRRKSLEYELKLKSQEDAKLPTDAVVRLSDFPEKDELLLELESTKEQLNTLLKQHEELEMKSKSDIKVLVKEVKNLRRSQIELKQKLDESSQKKMEMEQLLQQEIEKSEITSATRRKLLDDCQKLQIRLQECNIKFVDNNIALDSSSLSDVLDLLAESDKQLGLLFVESQQLTLETDSLSDSDDVTTIDHELRIVLRNIFLDNVKLRKQVNVFIRSALETDNSNENGNQAFPRETVLKQVFEN
ncbi:PX domain-containing protein EREL1-like isoform X2 [Amaranthus tricolor]|uniref:PX domain-containing protein EREL1-like isoform X2 n=1 Tax=Amaranthus tricolor TaxID=29722 RepID=UPI0025870C4E|nr:PX domain-containing protein EREL1-like isoform X2 [Amaranthus tricolor]